MLRRSINYRRFCLKAAFAVALCCLTSCAARTAEQPTAMAGEKSEAVPLVLQIEPQVDELLREMSRFLRSRNTFALKAEIIRDEVLPTGERVQFGRRTSAVIRRPDRLWAKTDGDRRQGEMFYDGKQVTLFDSAEKHYAVVDAPSSIDETFDYLVEEYGFSIPLADLFFSDPYTVLSENLTSGRYLGLSTIDQIKCHHLAFRQANIDWQLWIADGKEPLPKKIVITYKREFGVPQFAAVFSGWDFSTETDEQRFLFVAPKGVEQIELLSLADSLED